MDFQGLPMQELVLDMQYDAISFKTLESRMYTRPRIGCEIKSLHHLQETH